MMQEVEAKSCATLGCGSLAALEGSDSDGTGYGYDYYYGLL
jgi:hypothetical protein